MKCAKCKKEFDEKVSNGICPYCGEKHEVPEKKLFCKWCGKKLVLDKVYNFCPFCGEDLSEKAVKKGKKVKSNPKWLSAGTIIHDRYEIVKTLGAGGFGITYQVYDRNTGIDKALKEYFQQGICNRVPGTTKVLLSDPNYQKQFDYGKNRLLQEAQVVAKFQSPNIVRVNDFFEENDTSYMVMEYLPYDSLKQVLKNHAQMDVQTIVEIIIKVCEALEEIHSYGVIHRDIAPDNIILTDKNEVKIIDFGSARLSSSDVVDNLIAVKPGFAPPEQYKPIDIKNDLQKEWTDVYAVGATLYSLLTGIVPKQSTDRKIIIDQNKGQLETDPVVNPVTINPSIPENLNNTIMKAMALNIHERFKNTTELKKALLGEIKVEKIETVRKRKRMRRKISIATGFLFGFILLGIGLGIYQNKRKNFDFLEKADITIWYSYDQNDENKKKMLEDIIQELEDSDKYANVSFSLEAIPADEYEEKLKKADENQSLPTIFEYTNLNENSLENISSLNSSFKNCYFVEDFEENTISTGFNVPVIYFNYLAIDNPDEFTGIEVSKIEDLFEITSIDNISMNMELESQYQQMFEDYDQFKDSISKGYDEFVKDNMK